MSRHTFLHAAALAALMLCGTAMADEASAPQGIYLTTDYPALTLQSGETSTIGLEVHNRGTAPEALRLDVEGTPKGWKATLLGHGRPVAAVMPGTDQNLDLQLRLEIPAGQKVPDQKTLTVTASGAGHSLRLPLSIALADKLPAQLSIQPDLPQLTGSASSSFDFQLKIKNDSGTDVLASLAASAPKYFDVSFTEGYGSQQISAVPIKAGESKTVKLRVKPPASAESGEHEIHVRVAAEGAQADATLKMNISGQPRLDLAGRDGLLSTSAQIGAEASMPLEITNSGTVTAQDIALSGTAPSGWKLSFAPERIATLEPGKSTEVQAHITPSAKSLSGDYMVRMNARAEGQTANADLRVAVTTSSLWGVSGAILIAIALLILIGAVARYGRR